jgi:hypothetical protein
MLMLHEATKTLEETLAKKPVKVDKNFLRDFLYQLNPTDRFLFLEQLPLNEDIKRKVIEDITRYIMSPAGLLCEIPKSSLNKWLKQLLCESLFLSEFNKTEIKESIREKFNKWPVGIKSLSTHQAKLADTKSKTSHYSPVRTRNSELPYICSSTLNSHVKQVSIAASSKAIFIETEFIYKGAVTNVVESLLNEDTEIIEGLLNIGFSTKQIEILTNDIKKNLNNKDRWAGDFPQTCYPLDNNCERYINITSLPAVGVAREINLRSKKRFVEDDGNLLITTGCKIGGTKPQNAGTYNLSTGGHQRHLLSRIFFKEHKSPLAKQLQWSARKKTLFNFHKFNWKFLEQTHSEARNEAMKKFLARRICLILERVCSTYGNLESHILLGKPLPKAYQGAISVIDDLELKYAFFLFHEEPLLAELFNETDLKIINATDKKKIAEHIKLELIKGIKIDLNVHPFDIPQLLQKTVENYLFGAKEKGK